jgi:chemotaxis protein methyltransferase CheR
MTHVISPVLLAQLSDFITAQMGLHFPGTRCHDLERGILAAAREFDFVDAAACIQWLVSSPLTQQQIAILASHLTNGETYFLREPHIFAGLEEEILPTLMRARQESTRCLRIWSAGCATGEEPYSIAISISKMISDLQDWNITLLATDINPRFQQAAAAGVYREWSFREAPPWIKARYFAKQPGGRLAILPAIQKMVTFAYLNLIDDVYPSLLTNTTAVDVIFCRNVLMYFAPEQAKKVVHKLYHALADGGWLIVGPSETSQVLFASFQMVNIPGAILYRKGVSCEPRAASFRFPASSQNSGARQVAGQHSSPATLPSKSPELTSYRDALALFQQGRSVAVADKGRARGADAQAHPPALALFARACANQGRLPEARQWCEHALAVDPLNARLHYLHATILQAQDAVDEAMRALRRALYVDPDFVLAHLSLGTLARRQGQGTAAGKHFETLLALLRTYRPDDLLPESEGLTVGRLREMIAALAATHTTRGVRPPQASIGETTHARALVTRPTPVDAH